MKNAGAGAANKNAGVSPDDERLCCTQCEAYATQQHCLSPTDTLKVLLTSAIADIPFHCPVRNCNTVGHRDTKYIAAAPPYDSYRNVAEVSASRQGFPPTAVNPSNPE